MHIKCEGLPSGGGIAGAAAQATTDILQANTSPHRGETVHAFGDGATWPKEEITGWGIQLQREGGEALEEACGRTPGVQQNDGSETYAILQSLLRTHTTDDIELYCDNQGCVNNWDRTMTKQGKRKTRQKYAAIWTIIKSIVQERTMRGSRTCMHWIQSHVQDEKKRKSTGSKVMCACRKASGCENECTIPGSVHHWMHEGNDKADRLAKQSKGMSEVSGMTELLKGEEAYVLGNSNGVAQGGYREWIVENLIKKYIKESTSIGMNRMEAAKGKAQLTLWTSMVKKLDSAGGLSWRLWSRMLTETLPTNHKLSRMAGSNDDNIYKWVYREELGEEGECKRKGCTEESETTEHAICGCKWA